MANKKFIARADDLASSLSANSAIDKVARAGFIKNVSIMACGPYLENAAELLAHRKDICFGLHTTLNAEWDKIKWGPVTNLSQSSGLINEKGQFLSHPAMFLQTKPSVEVIMGEVSAQLDKLIRHGFDIKYIDSHMFSEAFVEGMDEAMEGFIKQKGLVDHMYFYNIPPSLSNFSNGLNEILKKLSQLPQGQYFFVTHPSLDTEEMRQTGNSEVKGGDVAKARASETAFFSDAKIIKALRDIGCESIRYDEASLTKRLTVESLKAILSPKEQNGEGDKNG